MVVRTGERMSLEAFLATTPETNQKIELIDGAVVVMGEGTLDHSDVIVDLNHVMDAWARPRGGRVYAVGCYAVLTPLGDYVEPDVLLMLAGHLRHQRPRPQTFPPDIVVEVSSPSTRYRDLGRKRDGYEAMGVPEYWFVDLKDRSMLVFRLIDGRYGAPERVTGVHATAVAPGLLIDLGAILPPG